MAEQIGQLEAADTGQCGFEDDKIGLHGADHDQGQGRVAHGDGAIAGDIVEFFLDQAGNSLFIFDNDDDSGLEHASNSLVMVGAV